MSNNDSTRAGDIKEFTIGNLGQDLSMLAIEIYYYEDVFQPSIEARIQILETGMSDNKAPIGILNDPSNPIRGGEEVNLVIRDNQQKPTTLSFKGSKSLYVNKVSNMEPGTQKDYYSIDVCSKEHLDNNLTRVVKRYNEKISESVSNILTNVLGTTKTKDIDSTALPYNFIGNDRKPFYICSWLAGKSVPETGGKKAGYFFFENYDGFKFKAIDNLLTGSAKKKYVLTGKPGLPPSGDYDSQIVSVNVSRYIDLERNLNMGMYANRTLYFDYVAMEYKPREYSISEQKDGVNNAGKQDLSWTATAFSQSPSRLMSHVYDIGTLPSGDTPKEQLKTWKNTPEGDAAANFDAYDTMVQSFMRYNQLFTIKTDVMIAGDFSLRAGDLVYCEFPTLTVDKNKPVNKETGGIYMIASLCHRITRDNCYTSLTLVRDTFGRKPF